MDGDETDVDARFRRSSLREQAQQFLTLSSNLAYHPPVHSFPHEVHTLLV